MNIRPNSKIFAYWEGCDRPALYELCLQSIASHNASNFLIVEGPDHFTKLTGIKLPDAIAQCYVVHRCDWIRKVLLHSFGGVYIDADFICFENLNWLVNLSERFDFVGYREWPGNWMDNFFAAKQGSTILHTAAEHALRAIEAGDTPWLAPNAHAIEHGIKAHEWDSFWLTLPTHLVSPISVLNAEWFLTPTDDLHVAPHRCFGYMTSFHTLRAKIANWSRAELMEGKLRICHLLRLALSNPSGTSTVSITGLT